MTAQLVEETEKPKKALRRKIEELGEELGYLQRKCRELGIPVLIVVEGWSAAGKGSMINKIIQPLDPRGFKVTCITSPVWMSSYVLFFGASGDVLHLRENGHL